MPAHLTGFVAGDLAHGVGKHCRITIHGDDAELARLRRQYEHWHKSLGILAHRLKGKLETMTVMPPDAPRRPWTDELAQPEGRALDGRRLDLTDGARRAIVEAVAGGELVTDVARRHLLTYDQVRRVLRAARAAKSAEL